MRKSTWRHHGDNTRALVGTVGLQLQIACVSIVEQKNSCSGHFITDVSVKHVPSLTNRGLQLIGGTGVIGSILVPPDENRKKEHKKTSRIDTFDDVWEYVPHFSLYQFGITIFASMYAFIAGMWLIYPIFAMYIPRFTCRENGLETCYAGDNSNNQTACTAFDYSFNGTESRNDELMSSLVSDADMVCDMAWAVPFGIAIKSVTILLGNGVGSFISDNYGRRLAMLISSLGIVIFSYPLPYTNTWYGFVILHMFLHGFVQVGYLTCCVYVFEMMGPSKRHLAIMTSIMFSLGYGSVSLWSWLLPRWDHMTLCLSAISSLVIFAYFLPESPQFLWSAGRFQEAGVVLEMISNRAGVEVPLDIITFKLRRSSQMQRASVIERKKKEKTITWRDMLKSLYFLKTCALMCYIFVVGASGLQI